MRQPTSDYAEDAGVIALEIAGLKDGMRQLTTALKENTDLHREQFSKQDERIRVLEIKEATNSGKQTVWLTIGLVILTPLAALLMRLLFPGK